MAYLLLMAALASAAAARPAVEPRLLNLHELVSSDDYPRAALERGMEGAVKVSLDIDADGYVTGCEVVGSSDSAALDEQTCALFRARARFEPAHDRRGRDIASTAVQTIRWVIPEPEEFARQPWMFRQTMAFDRDGKLVSCTDDSVGVPAASSECEAVLHTIQQPGAGGRGPPDGESIVETYFLPVDPNRAVIPPEVAGATKVARQISRVVIDADGKIISCTGVSYSGIASPDRDACAFASSARFTKADDASPAAPLVGTMVMTVYIRKQSVT